MPEKTKFLIAPLDKGQQTNVRPWLIPDEAFERLRNAYVWRGRLRKRFGTRYMGNTQLTSRLRIKLGTTDGAGNFSSLPNPPNSPVPGTKFNIGQMFSIGTALYTVVTAGAVQPMLQTVVTATATFDTINGNYDFAGAPANTDVYWYPADPVMGLITYDTALINDELLYAFDTQFSYQFIAGGWDRLGTATWTGNNAQFFLGTNWRGITADNRYLFVTNYNLADRIKYWNGAAWTTFVPFLDAGMTQQLFTARILIPFKNRLVALNTIETGGTFVNRCRYSQNGDPVDVNNSWVEQRGRGGFSDAPTNESIISAEFIKDRLIVFFEASTWELVYNSNQLLPFVWQQINTELGAESTFSIVPFDKVLLAIGQTGINACNGANVERIDELIPDDVWSIHNGNQGLVRVHGIRDYFTEQVYWTFPNAANNPTFPNQVLVYDYRLGTWSYNDDSFTTFGYFQPVDDRQWQSMVNQWQTENTPWNLGTLQSQFRDVVAGNQEGYVCIVEDDVTNNAAMLQVTDISVANPAILTIINHNLQSGDAVYLEGAGGTDISNDQIYQVTRLSDDTINLSIYQGNNVFALAAATTAYTGGGTLARVSQIDILTKQYNFFASQYKDAFIQKVNFLVERTSNGQILIDYFVNANNFSMVQASLPGTGTGAIMGTNILQTTPFNTFEQLQDRLWHMVYFQAEGNVIQFRIYLGNDQLYSPAIAFAPFTMHAMLIFASPTARLE